MIVHSAKSLFLYGYIQLSRFIDHTTRRLTGLPTLKRSEITPQVYLGGQYGLQALPLFKKLGITGIVNMRSVSKYTDTQTQDFHTLHLPTQDFHAPSIKQLTTGVDFIQNEIKNGGKVYIHCRLGEGRGPTMTIAYLMSTGLTFEDAYTLVKKIRGFIQPTKAQIDRLRELETNYRLEAGGN